MRKLRDEIPGALDEIARLWGLTPEDQERIAAEVANECSIEGCERPRRSKGAKWCEMHYYRNRRHGDPGRVHEYAGRGRHSEGYSLVRAPDHPLADSRGYVAEHRFVLYAAIGDGPHDCHWCGKTLEWTSIAVDHLNEVRTDNRIENLAASCIGCNAARSTLKPAPAEAELRNALARNGTIAGIAREFGVGHSTAGDWLDHYGIERPGPGRPRTYVSRREAASRDA